MNLFLPVFNLNAAPQLKPHVSACCLFLLCASLLLFSKEEYKANVRDGLKADIKRWWTEILSRIGRACSKLVLMHIASNKLLLFLSAMCVKVWHTELRYATEDHKANVRDRTNPDIKMIEGLLLLPSCSNLVLTHIAIAMTCNRRYKANVRKRIKVDTNMNKCR